MRDLGIRARGKISGAVFRITDRHPHGRRCEAASGACCARRNALRLDDLRRRLVRFYMMPTRPDIQSLIDGWINASGMNLKPRRLVRLRGNQRWRRRSRRLAVIKDDQAIRLDGKPLELLVRAFVPSDGACGFHVMATFRDAIPDTLRRQLRRP